MAEATNASGKRLTRFEWYRILLHFAVTRSRSLLAAARLFYHAGLKPALAFRGWSHFDRAKILSFSARGTNGRKLTVHARDNGSDVGTFEEFFSSRYRILPPELPALEPKVIYDIGANIGIASLYYAGYFPDARFFGFEPVPDNLEVCRRNYGNLRDSEVFPWAIGARSQISTFEFAECDLRGGGLHGAMTTDVLGAKKRIEVQVYSVADLITEKKLPPPGFVKIDVEGAEFDVLQGIGDQGRTIKRILIETHGEQLMIDCMKWVLNHGFIILHVHSLPGGFSSIWADRIG
jgi:FkbM family methyltransferase